MWENHTQNKVVTLRVVLYNTWEPVEKTNKPGEPGHELFLGEGLQDARQVGLRQLRKKSILLDPNKGKISEWVSMWVIERVVSLGSSGNSLGLIYLSLDKVVSLVDERLHTIASLLGSQLNFHVKRYDDIEKRTW